MRNMAALGFVLLAAFATPALGQSLVGGWTATAHTPDGKGVSETLDVSKTDDGYAINATLIGAPAGAPAAGPGADIALDGDNFFYKRTVTTPDGSVTITYSGVVSGDTFTGTADMGFAKAPYTGLRIKAAK